MTKTKLFVKIGTVITAIALILTGSFLPAIVENANAAVTTNKQWGKEITDAALNQWNGQRMPCTVYLSKALSTVYGISIPSGTTQVQVKWLKANTREVPKSEAKPGDILGFYRKGNNYTHVAILGGNNTLHHGGVSKANKVVYQYSPGSFWTGSGERATNYTVFRVIEDSGKLNLQKSVANNKALTDLCKNQYSLAGAVYGVYDSSNTKVGTLTTDASGKSNTIDVKPGTYTLREEKAPNGYAINSNPVSATVTGGNTTTAQHADEPLFDPVDIVLKKSENKTQKNPEYLTKTADLSGAEFEISYYDTGANSPAGLKPVRTWRLKTVYNEAHKAYLARLTDDYKVSGDDFFKTEAGNVVIPVGLITAKEVKAPNGFKLDPTVHSYQIKPGNNGTTFTFTTPDLVNDYLVPKIRTTATDGITNKHIGNASGKVKIKDVVSYTELGKGKHTVTATLMDKATNKPLLDAKGNKITLTKDLDVTDEMIAAKGYAEGNIEMETEVDAEILKGKTIVYFESLKYDGKEVALHADINDEGQSVRYPRIGTKMTSNGAKAIAISKETPFTDEIAYENLPAGKYHTKTTLMALDRDGKVEPVLGENNEPLTVKKNFEVTEEKGTVNVDFKLDTSKFSGKSLVCFEEVYDSTGTLVAEHKDKNDKGQTVDVGHNIEVSIAKADKKDVKHFLAGAEITIFDEKGNVVKDIFGKDCVGITDKDGNVKFTIFYNAAKGEKLYAQETKAPASYQINKNKFEITPKGTDDTEKPEIIPISILDEALIIPPHPKTGDVVKMLIPAVGGVVALAAIVTLVVRKKRKN